jgi:phage recombination protein Bet
VVEQSKALATIPDSPWTNEQVALIKRTVADGATNDELALFLNHARKMGLDPLARQIHFVKRQDKGTIQVAIDGFRLIADRTGKYAGNDDPEYGIESNGHPIWAKVTVWKLVGGQRCPFTATARWEEYCPKGNQGFMWNKMPYLMLGKCAEALALRKAFPAELSGTYIPEEMDQAGTVDTTATVVTGETSALTCVQCHQPVLATQIGKQVISPAKVVENTVKKFGRELCYRCGQAEQARRDAEAAAQPAEPEQVEAF